MLGRVLLFAVAAVTGQELVKVGSVGAGLLSTDLARLGDYTFSLLDTTVKITNVADKMNPVEIGSLTHLGQKGLSVEADGNLFYVGYESSVIVYDMSTNPANPDVVFTLDLGADWHWRGMAQSADHIFVSYFAPLASTETFYVLAKNTLTQVGSFSLTKPSTFIFDMVYANGKVYATKDDSSAMDSIAVIDVSDPTNPFIEVTYDSPIIAFNKITYHEGFLYISRLGDEVLKVNAATGEHVPLVMPSGTDNCGDVKFYNSKMYLACESIFVLEETAPNTWTVIASDADQYFSILVEGGYLYASGPPDKLAIYNIPDAMVVLVGGKDPVEKLVGAEGSSTEEELSGQKWVDMPSWLAGSSAHMGAHGKKGMSLRLTCLGSDPCTFYVTLHNCLPCSSALNGGLPHGLLDAGFEAGSCGPKYVPTFSGAPSPATSLPTATFRRVEVGGAPSIEIPLTRDLLHFSVFVQRNAGNGGPLCGKKPSGPAFSNRNKCTCFSAPSF